MIGGENHGATGQNLKDHFCFAESRGGDDQSFGGSNLAQTDDDELPADDDHDHPGLNESHLHQRNESSRNQKLVGNGIKKNSQSSDFAALAGNVTVHYVGGGGHRKNQDAPNFKMNRQAPKIQVWFASQQDNYQQRDEKYPED